MSKGIEMVFDSFGESICRHVGVSILLLDVDTRPREDPTGRKDIGPR